MKTPNKFLYFSIVLLTIGLFVYGNIRYFRHLSEGFSINNYLENPNRFGEHKDERFGKIINISEDHFYFSLGDINIKIYGAGIKKPIFGETVVFVNYGRDGKITLIDYHNYNYNYLLYILSFFALVIFVIIFLKEWKITPRGFKDKNA